MTDRGGPGVMDLWLTPASITRFAQFLIRERLAEPVRDAPHQSVVFAQRWARVPHQHPARAPAPRPPPRRRTRRDAMGLAGLCPLARDRSS